MNVPHAHHFELTLLWHCDITLSSHPDSLHVTTVTCQSRLLDKLSCHHALLMRTRLHHFRDPLNTSKFSVPFPQSLGYHEQY